MATLNTPEQNGRLILDIFVKHFKSRPNDVLRANNFMAMIAKHNFNSEDILSGLEFAAVKEWIEVLNNGTSYRLTEAGFTEA